MLLDGCLRAEVGGDQRVRTGASSSQVPNKVLDGGPILTFRGGQATTVSVPDKTIALTFDDGPNPTWTPQVLAILKKYDIPATFFLVGSMVSRYPGIVADLVEQGNEVGIHTFTHVDLSYLAPVPVLLLSLAPILAVHFLWEPPDNRFGGALTDLATFFFCWLLGFAHRDGVLRRLKPLAVAALSLAAIAYGGWYAFTHQAETGSYDLDDIPLAQTFWSAGYVTLLMYAKEFFRVDFARLTRVRPLDRLVTVFNTRAVMIYLWHEIALILAVPLIDRFWNVPAFEKYLPLESQWFMFGIGWILVAVFVLLCGWVEDMAGKKKPTLVP
ncbi:polysaccharide deacetylase family protein [Streptomyces sp. NPDC048558]|uniref:polysaccharide deacetylase family protein n=1 Tax=Streptomyces sp. NPDC048558 TaxID=3155759 RepID=UPI00343ED31B